MIDRVKTSTPVASLAYRNGSLVREQRPVPEETAVAISVNGTTHAVMMATPDHLDELAVGLALNEGIVAHPSEIERLDIEPGPLGVDCRLWLSDARAVTYVARRRQMTGPVGCGLCGVESLELARPQLSRVTSDLDIDPAAIVAAMDAMGQGQTLGRETRAVHAAAFHPATSGQIIVREDVGRHNALDKVAGRLALDGIDPARGFLTLTSRVSVELIQKAARMGTPLLAAVSVPTALAIRTAEEAGITLVAIARGDEFEIFTYPERIRGAGSLGGL